MVTTSRLYFYYGTVNSGKTLALLQTEHSYRSHNFPTYILKPAIDSKGGDTIVSRIGLDRPVDIQIPDDASLQELLAPCKDNSHIFIDEAQFLSPAQVDELFLITTNRPVTIYTYGLRTDFQTVPFAGSARLLQIAHQITEIPTVCHCGDKAILNSRKVDGHFVTQGAQVVIDDDTAIEYVALCANDYNSLVLKGHNQSL